MSAISAPWVFRNNDVVGAVNGVALDSLVALNEARKTMQRDGSVTLKIRRNNKDVELRINLR